LDLMKSSRPWQVEMVMPFMLGDNRICILVARRLPPLLVVVPPHRIRCASGATTMGYGGVQKGHAGVAPPAGSGIGMAKPTLPLPTQLLILHTAFLVPPLVLEAQIKKPRADW
jgi:hypothetical protein